MAAALTITTDRLVMTPHAIADFAEMAAMWADPQVVRFLGGAPHSEEDCWARLLRYAGNWTLLGFGSWAVRLRDGGADENDFDRVAFFHAAGLFAMKSRMRLTDSGSGCHLPPPTKQSPCWKCR